MLIVQVFIQVKPQSVEAFKAASMENAAASIREPGCARFDVIQQLDDPTRFVLYEAYRSQGDNDLHKHSAHYLRWRDTVAGMQAEERYSIKYTACFPPDDDWK
ncbi:MAG TPA: putative quinol monooxygenase [Deltaproteobacteria bacterium]|nr:putative quinol monooxygenase [Deltaproteobacteria bacterium]